MKNKKYQIILLSLFSIFLFSSFSISSAVVVNFDNLDKIVINDDTQGPFCFLQKSIHNFGYISQEGIASDDKGHFFISSAFWPYKGSIIVAEINKNTGKFEKSSINGISEIDIGWHVGDPFCDNNFLFVPWINWDGFHEPTKAKCYVYQLSDLSEISGSPFDLIDNKGYLPGAGSGAFYNNYYYICSYFPSNSNSTVYKFSFNPNIGFCYENEFFDLGKSEVQGIEFLNDKCYFIREHGKDPNVYWINTTTWNNNDLGKQNIQFSSKNSNGPYEGITFDTSNKDIIAYFGFGSWTFESFTYTGRFSFSDLETTTEKISWKKVVPKALLEGTITIKNVGDPGSKLYWEVNKYPDWGMWAFTPEDTNSGITPEDGEFIINFSVFAPYKRMSRYNGEIKIVNKENENDFVIINIFLTTPRSINIKDLILTFLNRCSPIQSWCSNSNFWN